MTPQTTSSSRSSVIRVRPYGNAAREVLRPVDRVDDPPDPGVVAAFLLTEDALVRTAVGDPLPECALDRPVGVRQRRQVGLRLDAQVERLKRGRLNESARSASSSAKASSEEAIPSEPTALRARRTSACV
jgi:hypothetical protein